MLVRLGRAVHPGDWVDAMTPEALDLIGPL